MYKFLLSLFSFILFSACALFQPSAKKLTNRALSANKQYDAVIVPGVPFLEPKWDRTMQMRVIWAIHLYKTGIAKKIIMSGSSVYSPYVEAQIMKLYAIEYGVAADDIIIEDKAQHSTENIWYSYKLAKSLGYQKIALSTDPFQTRMTYRFGKRRLKDLNYLPVIFDTLKTLQHLEPEIKFQSYKIENFIPITETQSFWYRFKGTMGKHINFKE
ncbi:MAG: YdcF family protein [Burkholderiales bacterium]|nr:YdcF family protein [Bacteroidia bacterium]